MGYPVGAKGADETWSSNSAGTSQGIGRARGPGGLVSVGVADEDTRSFSARALDIDRAGGPGSLVSAGGEK